MKCCTDDCVSTLLTPRIELWCHTQITRHKQLSSAFGVVRWTTRWQCSISGATTPYNTPFCTMQPPCFSPQQFTLNMAATAQLNPAGCSHTKAIFVCNESVQALSASPSISASTLLALWRMHTSDKPYFFFTLSSNIYIHIHTHIFMYIYNAYIKYVIMDILNHVTSLFVYVSCYQLYCVVPIHYCIARPMPNCY